MLKMLKNANDLGTKKDEIFHCKKCDYTTCHIGHWKRHLKTRKHNAKEMLKNANDLGTKRTKGTKLWECACGKTYKHQSSFCRHTSTCSYVNDSDENQIITKNEETDMNTILTVMKELVLQNKTLTEALKAEKENAKLSIAGNNNNMNSNNTNFNIQLFLNEDCKNATSIQDFAKQLKITMADLSLLKDNEPKAITSIITKNLKDYTVTDRPVHHHEKKWYIKDDQEGWEDDDGKKLVKHTKTAVSQKAGPTFVENNPDWLQNQKKGEAYAETVAVAMKDVSDRNTNKILKNVKVTCEVNEN